MNFVLLNTSGIYSSSFGNSGKMAKNIPLVHLIDAGTEQLSSYSCAIKVFKIVTFAVNCAIETKVRFIVGLFSRV